MIKFYIIGQTIRFATPAIAADSLNYLECEFDFSGGIWEEASKWIHFRQECSGGDIVYDIAIENNQVTADKKLNLTQGEWETYVTGTVGETRLTTVPVIITVYESGLIDGPLHEIPLTVAEQIDARSAQAVLIAQTVKEAAERGEFDGRDFEISEYYADVDELYAKGKRETGYMYGVGTEPPLSIYGWSEEQQDFVNIGTLQGAQGEQGKQGVTFTPNVDSSGFISWTNDGGLENPEPRNITGPVGPEGKKGEDGKGPFEYAQEGGYTGTEETFLTAITQFPYHHARHEADGADPITVTGAMVAPETIARANLAADAKCASVDNIVVPTDAWEADSTFETHPFAAKISILGVSAQHSATVVFSPSSGEGMAPVSRTEEGSVTIYAESVPEKEIHILSIVLIPVGAMSNVSGDYPVYAGSYLVTPAAGKQTLDTDNKVLLSDITINEIPVVEVTNDSGGTTMIIA